MTVTRRGQWSRRLGAWLLGVTAVIALAAPVIAPNAPTDQFEDYTYAPPSRVHLIGPHGLTAPFIHPLVLENRLASQYREDRSVVIPLRWFDRGRLVSTDATSAPLLLLGADAIGRDVFSRFVLGARLSLGVTLVGVIGALTIGGAVGAVAGTIGGRVDRVLMLIADFLLAVPGVYLVLVLRGALRRPVLETEEVFGLIAILFSVAAWPHTARGVRAIVMSERRRDYAEAARAAGAGPWRLARQLLPAATGFLAVEVVLLVPALLVAEATISYLGLGFVEPSWGTMMHDAVDSGQILADAPWLLAPAAGVFIVALAAQLLGTSRGQAVAWLQAPRSS